MYINDVVPVSLLLTLHILYILFSCVSIVKFGQVITGWFIKTKATVIIIILLFTSR